MMHARFAAPVAILLGLALVPTAIHSYRGTVLPDGLTTRAIPAQLAGAGSTPTSRRGGWVSNAFASDDWVERTYRLEGQEVTLFAARSYDPKRLYHHPELALLRGTETAGAGLVHVPARPHIPLHVLTTSRGGRQGVAVYALLYDGRFIAHPITFQLRTSAELLVRGRKPMTLLFASDLSGSPEALSEAPAARIVLAAIDAFQAQPRTLARW
jgi:hypothetical protein